MRSIKISSKAGVYFLFMYIYMYSRCVSLFFSLTCFGDVLPDLYFDDTTPRDETYQQLSTMIHREGSYPYGGSRGYPGQPQLFHSGSGVVPSFSASKMPAYGSLLSTGLLLLFSRGIVTG